MLCKVVVLRLHGLFLALCFIGLMVLSMRITLMLPLLSKQSLHLAKAIVTTALTVRYESVGKKMGKPVWGTQVSCRKFQSFRPLGDLVERNV